VLSYGKQCTQYGPLETHVIAKVFHVDSGMFIGDSPGCRNVRRTSHVERVKGHHDGGQFSHARHHVTAAAAGELIDCVVQFGNYCGKIQQLRFVRCTDVYGERMKIASNATRRLRRPITAAVAMGSVVLRRANKVGLGKKMNSQRPTQHDKRSMHDRRGSSDIKDRQPRACARTSVNKQKTDHSTISHHAAVECSGQMTKQ